MPTLLTDEEPEIVWTTHTPPQARLLSVHAPAHLKLTRRLAAYIATRHNHAAARLSECCRTPALYQEEGTGRYVLSQKTCKHRLCPRCAKAKSIRLQKDAHAIVSRMDSPRFVTLTTKSTDQPLEDQLKHLRESFARLRKSKTWKRYASRGISVVEVTHNKETDRWHPHIHAIVDGSFFPHKLLREAWHQASTDSTICHIRPVPARSDAIRYVAKYAAKTGDFNAVPDWRINEYLDALAGLRTHALFGPGARKCLPAKEKTERGRLLPISQLGVFHDLARGGNLDARQLLTLIYRLGRRQLPNPAPGAAPELEACHGEITRLLRLIGVEGQDCNSSNNPTELANPPPVHSADCRPIRLWEESDTSAAAIAH